MKRQEFSKATKLLAWNRANGRCEKCTAKLFTSNTEYHHDIEDAFNGGNSLLNCMCVCRICHRLLTNSRAVVIAKSTRVRNKHIGIKRQRSSFATNRDGLFKKKISGEVVRR